MNPEQKFRHAKIFYEEFYLLNLAKEYSRSVFSICGSTSNVYKICLYDQSRKLFCNCPDAKSHARKKNVYCKHVCFVLFKILKNSINLNDTDIFNTHQLSLEEYNNCISKINILNLSHENDFVDKDLIQKYELVKNLDPKQKFEVTKTIKDEDLCPICFDEFINDKTIEKLQCPTCNNIFHKPCIEKWIRTKRDNSCPYCRGNVWDGIDNNNIYHNLE